MTASVKIRDHLRYKLAGAAMFFLVKKINLTHGAYAQSFEAIFIPIFTTGELKVLLYFGNVGNNSAALHAFGEFLKVTKYTLRCPAHLILSECFSLGLPLWLRAQP